MVQVHGLVLFLSEVQGRFNTKHDKSHTVTIQPSNISLFPLGLAKNFLNRSLFLVCEPKQNHFTLLALLIRAIFGMLLGGMLVRFVSSISKDDVKVIDDVYKKCNHYI